MNLERKHMSTRDIILAGILLAAGAVIRMFFPKLPVTPNFIISMYCLVILLVRPRLVEALAIGVVAVTAEMDVRYRAPVALERGVVVRGAVEKTTSHPLYYVRGELEQDRKVVARASARFFVRGAF